MVDLDRAARQHAGSLTADPPPELVERLKLAALAFREGQAIAATEQRQSEFRSTKPKLPFGWKRSGWKRGMPGYLSGRQIKALPLLHRARGQHPRNWPAEQFIQSMMVVAALLGIEIKPPYYNTPNPSRFSALCDDWLAAFAPDAEIPIQTYHDVIERPN